MAISGTRILALVAATALLSGAACGSGSAKPSVAGDKAKAQSIVITSADVPDFTAEADDNSDEGSPNPLDRCVKNNPLLTKGDKPRGASGPGFTKDDGNLHIGSGVVFAEKEADARQAFSDLKGALVSQCVKDGLKAAVEDGAQPGLTVGNVSSAALPAPKVTDEVAASRLTVPLEAGGKRLSVFVDLTILRQGRVFGGVYITGSGSPFPDAERTRLATLVGKRMSGKARNTPDTGPKPTTSTTTGRSPTTGAAKTGYTPFRDPSGVTLEYPSAWSVEPSSASRPLIVYLDRLGAGPFRRNLNLLQPPRTPASLDEYTRANLKELSDIPGSTTGESRPTTLSGSPAYRVTYRADLGKGELRFLVVWTIHGGKAWQMTYTSEPTRFDDGLPDVERLLTSLKLPG